MDLLCHILGRIVKAFSHLLPERKLRKVSDLVYPFYYVLWGGIRVKFKIADK